MHTANDRRIASNLKRKSRWLQAFPFVVLAAYIISNACLFSFAGDFPLNDDWMYGLEVQKYLQSGQLHLIGGSPSCALHVLVGALICRLTGFSFIVLRYVTLGFAFVAVSGMYLLLRELQMHRRVALLAAAVIATNPLFVNLSYCYMTDVPCLAYVFVYAWLLVCSIRKRSAPIALIAALCHCASIFVRQNALALVLCNFVVTLILWKRSSPAYRAALVVLCLGPLACAYYSDHLMSVINDYPGAYDWYKLEIERLMRLAVTHPFSFVFKETVAAVKASAYLGIFSAPLLISWAMPKALMQMMMPRTANTGQFGLRRPLISWYFLSAVITLSGFTFLLYFEHKLMPFSPNLWHFPELGAATIISRTPSQIHDSNYAGTQLTLTAVSAGCASLVLFALICACFVTIGALLRLPRRNWIKAQSEGAAAIAFSVCAAAASFLACVLHISLANLDRYYILPVALIVCCICVSERYFRIPLSSIAAWVAIAITAVYSSFAQHDYLAWNEARWRALGNLTRQHIPPSTIDGGIEFNYLNNPALSNDLVLAPGTFVNIHRGRKPLSEMRYWSVPGEQYVISQIALPGYKLIGSYEYNSLLHWSKREISVYESPTSSPNSSGIYR